MLYCKPKIFKKETVYSSLHHGVRVKTLLYQNYNRGIKPKSLSSFLNASRLLKVNRVWLHQPFFHLYIYTQVTRTKIKIYSHGLSWKPRIKQGLSLTKTANQINPSKPKPRGFCKPRRPTIKCPIRDWTRTNCHGISKAYLRASGCPSLAPTMQKDKSTPVYHQTRYC